MVATTGNAPALASPISLNNDEDILVLHTGYAPVLLAAGYVAEKHQFLEPIPDGSGEWRPCLPGRSGPAKSTQRCDNSGGSAAVFCGAFVFAGAECCGSGLGAILADSAEIAGGSGFQQFSQKLSSAVRKFSMRAGTTFRYMARIKMTGLNASDTASFKVGLGTGGALVNAFASAAAIVFASGDIITITGTTTVRSVTTGSTPTATLSSAGLLVGGPAGGPSGYAVNPSLEGVTARVDQNWDFVASVAFSSTSASNKAKLLDLELDQIS